MPSGKWILRVGAVALITVLLAKAAGKQFGIGPLAEL